jgi:Protein of unknown function (DUF3267).
MSMARAQIVSLLLIFPVVAITVVPHWYLWALPETDLFPASLLGAFFASVVVHEAIHGLGFYWGGADWPEIEFGFKWSSLTPYAHCSVPLRAIPYRMALALPGLVLGVPPLLAGLSLGSWWLTLYAFLMLLGAAGDTLLLWMMRDVSGSTWVQDHPSQMGCLVLGHPSSTVAPTLVKEESPDTTDSSEDSGSRKYLIYFTDV